MTYTVSADGAKSNTALEKETDMTDNFPIVWGAIAHSARMSMEMDEEKIRRACEKTLRGKTPNEPRVEDCVQSIIVRGFFYENGTAWGIYNSREIVQLGHK